MNENYQPPAVPSPSAAPTPPPPLVTPSPFSKKTWWLVMALVVVVLAGVYYLNYFYSPGESPSSYNIVVKPKPRSVVPDETAVLENDLQAVPLSGLDSELKDIEVELGK